VCVARRASGLNGCRALVGVSRVIEGVVCREMDCGSRADVRWLGLVVVVVMGRVEERSRGGIVVGGG
jgi:hypothetical protein